ARSRAIGSVMPTTPPFDAEYAAWPICPSNAAADAVLITTPRSPSAFGAFFAICAAASRITLNVPIRLISITLVKIASGIGPSRPTVFIAAPTPAQLTATWIVPKRATAFPIAALTSASLVTSAGAKRTRSPSSAATLSPAAPGRSTITARPPAPTSSWTVARPSPDAPPVTNATVSAVRMRRGHSRRAGRVPSLAPSRRVPESAAHAPRRAWPSAAHPGPRGDARRACRPAAHRRRVRPRPPQARLRPRRRRAAGERRDPSHAAPRRDRLPDATGRIARRRAADGRLRAEPGDARRVLPRPDRARRRRGGRDGRAGARRTARRRDRRAPRLLAPPDARPAARVGSGAGARARCRRARPVARPPSGRARLPARRRRRRHRARAGHARLHGAARRPPPRPEPR